MRQLWQEIHGQLWPEEAHTEKILSHIKGNQLLAKTAEHQHLIFCCCKILLFDPF